MYTCARTVDIHAQYSSNQMQGTYMYIANAFIARDKHIYRWRQACLLLETNVASTGDEHV